MIHRDYFFDNLRYYLFKSFTQQQVDGLNVFLDYYDQQNPPEPERYHYGDRELAYLLATTYHETAFTMAPLSEYGGEAYLKAKPYYPFYGRGYIQLTWEDNYKTQDAKLGLDGRLVATPDLALEPVIAQRIIWEGMADGDFTGKKLADYFTLDETDWYNARRIVNGTDCASTIAGYAEKFLNAIAHT
jgi:hypothetical protein